jgi:ElaB/YqjD/DUF883 family membrane-anchored ribosome-binding protein
MDQTVIYPKESFARGTQEAADRNLEQIAQDARARLEQVGRQVAADVDRGREAAVRGMEQSAAALSAAAGELPQKTERLADGMQRTAERIGTGARYLREHDVDRMLSDARETVRTHPGGSLALAAIAGFFVGLLLTRDHDAP